MIKLFERKNLVHIQSGHRLVRKNDHFHRCKCCVSPVFDKHFYEMSSEEDRTKNTRGVECGYVERFLPMVY